MVYIFSMVVAFGIAFINAMEGVGIELGMLTEWAKKLPLYELHVAGGRWSIVRFASVLEEKGNRKLKEESGYGYGNQIVGSRYG